MSGTRGGLAIAKGALVRTTPEVGQDARTLDELVECIAHITGTQVEWREAVAYLAAQVHTARHIGDAARGRDAQFALDQIETQVAWFRSKHGGAS